MATYYKYAERSADSQVNWAEVGKGISDMLSKEVAIREEKKAAYDETYRIDTDKLINAPQGKWQDGNATVNNFAHDMMEQQLIDFKLLKSGQMKERDYTLRRENFKSQTNTLFNLQKKLQSERESTIDLYQKGEIQGLNISNMADVEAYTDFANSKADIDPYAANINMSIYETNTVDGKEVKTIKKTTPVNVLMGQIVQKVPTFKVDEAINKDVESLGIDADVIYKAASLSGAGTITNLIGYGAIKGEYLRKNDKGQPLYPEFADSIKKMDDAIEQTTNKYFSNPYNISSVLTENTGKYDAESYTWSRDEAEKDKTKLLKKLDSITGLPILDNEAPHYKEQLEEARSWVKKTILGKLDSKRDVQTTTQTSLQERRAKTQGEMDKEKNKETAKNLAQNMIYSLTGNALQSDAGTKYLSSITGLNFQKKKQGYRITDEEGNEQEFIFKGDGKLADIKGFAKSLVGPVSKATGVSEEDVLKEFNSLLPSGSKINETSEADGFKAEAKTLPPIEKYNAALTADLNNKELVSSVANLSTGKAAKKAINASPFASKYGIKVDNTYFGENIYIPAQDGRPESPEFPVGSTAKNKAALKSLEAWMKKNYLKGATLEEKEAEAELINKTTTGGAGELDD
jgi:hypothetical protein